MVAWRFLIGVVVLADWAMAWSSGAVCNGVLTKTIDQMLTGKHLVVGMLVYKPFATYDPTKSGNAAWTGFDKDLLDYIATEANFTYSTVTIEPPTGDQTWDDVAAATTLNTDVVSSWWQHTMERRKTMVQLVGHIDSSLILVKDGTPEPEADWSNQAFLFMEPFSASLWILILGGIIWTGLMFGLLESNTGHQGSDFKGSKNTFGTIFKSVYLAFIAFNDQGGHAPKSAAGRCFLLAWGFTLTVMTASYTAELASFLVVQGTNAKSFGNIFDAEQQAVEICSAQNNPTISEIALMRAPTANIKLVPFTNMISELLGLECTKGGCCGSTKEMGALMLSPDITSLRTDDSCKYKYLKSAGNPVNINSAGWLTSRATPCVALTVDYYMQMAMDEGKVIELRRKWQPEAECGRVVEVEEEDEGRLTLGQLSGLYGIFFVASILVLIVQFLIDFQVLKEPMSRGDADAHMQHKLRATESDGMEMALSPRSPRAAAAAASVDLAAKGAKSEHMLQRFESTDAHVLSFVDHSFEQHELWDKGSARVKLPTGETTGEELVKVLELNRARLNTGMVAGMKPAEIFVLVEEHYLSMQLDALEAVQRNNENEETTKDMTELYAMLEANSEAIIELQGADDRANEEQLTLSLQGSASNQIANVAGSIWGACVTGIP